MAAAAAASSPVRERWDTYFKGPIGSAPFDSGRPASQLVHFLTACCDDLRCSIDSAAPPAVVAAAAAAQARLLLPPPVTAASQPQHALHVCSKCAASKPRRGGRALELGCGTGASSRWLAQLGLHVMAVDVSRVALAAAAAEAATDGMPPDNPVWLEHDVLRLGECQPPLAGEFDLVYDCQVYHVLMRDQPDAQEQLPRLLLSLLRPGGLFMVLAGNANEPEVGPNVMTAEELLLPLLSAGLQLVWLHATRFDETHHYVDVLHKRPLAWWVLLQRPPCEPEA